MKKCLIEPYELCPCGSRKKYKFCCKKQEKDQEFATLSLFEKELRTLANQKLENRCIFCGDAAINSHSISEKIQRTSLQSTEESNRGFIYTFVLDPKNAIKKGYYKEKLKKESIASTSISKSFCHPHDELIFMPIEKNNIYIKTEETDFLYAYRAFAKYFYGKQELLSNIRAFFELKPNFSAHDKEIMKDYREASERDEENKRLAKFFKENYILKNFKSISGTTKTVDRRIYFATSFVFCASFEDGRLRFDTNKGVPFFVNIFPEAKTGKSYIIINWIMDNTDDYLKDCVLKHLNVNDIEKSLTKTVLAMSNNIVFHYDTVDNLEDELKQEILDYRDFERHKGIVDSKEDCKINLFSENFFDKYFER